MLDFVGKRYWYIIFSLVILIPGVISLIIPPRLKLGIEFTSGTLISVRFEEPDEPGKFPRPVEQSALRAKLHDVGFGDAIIQRTGESEYLIRTRVLKGADGSSEAVAPTPTAASGDATPAPTVAGAEGAATPQATAPATETPSSGVAGSETEPPKPGSEGTAGGSATGGERKILEDALKEAFGPFTVLSFDAVSPIVAAEIVRNAGVAVVVASLGILIYITWAFRQVPSPFRYGVCAVLALIHDVLVLLGVFSIAGKLFGTEIDSLFITATLTVIGFSVHDTIVVFDRIRENVQRNPTRDFASNVNNSLIQTIGRSLTTSLTVVITLVALLLFGGVTMRGFVSALLIGIVSGTYSSIFVASQFLVIWEYGEMRRWFGASRAARAEAAR